MGDFMLTKRENLIEVMRGGTPDRFVNQYEAFFTDHGGSGIASISGRLTAAKYPGMDGAYLKYGLRERRGRFSP